MYAREFCYWLQGAFEIAELPVLTTKTNACIKKHLELVMNTDQEGQPKEVIEFCQWLFGGIDFIQQESLGHTEMVRLRLANVFRHTIDPSYEEHAQLGPLHGPGMRC